VIMDFVSLSQQCAPDVHHSTMAAIAHVESSYNPYAIGVVRGQLERQPNNKEEAVATALMLEKAGYNFSMGVGQVNKKNLAKYKLTYETAFSACENLRAASLILKDCFLRAKPKFQNDQAALQAAFSCYYSGNFTTGFTQDFAGQPSYVQKILSASQTNTAIAITVIPQSSKGRKNQKTISESSNETVNAMVFN
jgi:type IV secretion system protein VirB1